MNRMLKQLNLLFWLALLALVLPQFWAVSAAEVIVPPESVKEHIESYLRQTTPLNDQDIEMHIELERPPTDNIVLTGDTLNIKLSDNRNTTIPWHAIVHVSLTTESDSREIGFPVHVTINKPVWIVQRPVQAKTPLSRGDLAIERKELSFQADYYLSTHEDIGQYTTLVNLPVGQILDTRKLRRTPLVFRNDDVMILLTLPSGVKVSCYGMAMEDGALGQRIRVKHRQPDRKIRTYSGQVIGKNQIQVTL